MGNFGLTEIIILFLIIYETLYLVGCCCIDFLSVHNSGIRCRTGCGETRMVVQEYRRRRAC